MRSFLRLAAAIILLSAGPALSDEPAVKVDSDAFIISTSMQELRLPAYGAETYRL